MWASSTRWYGANSNNMSNKNSKIPAPKPQPVPIANSLLEKMVDGREFESLLHYKFQNINLIDELRRSIIEVKSIRQRPLLCYVANVVKPITGSINR